MTCPTLSIITRRVHPSLRDKVTPDASLKDLDLHLIDLVGITCDIEEHYGVQFPGDPEAAWETVADILEAAEKVCGDAVYG